MLDWAMINDVPGHPPGLPKFLADNGVKYLALGANQSLSKKLPDDVSNTPFWWETLDGKDRVLTFICAESYTGAYMKYGIDPQTSYFLTRKEREYPSTQPLDVMKQNMGEMLKEYRKREYPSSQGYSGRRLPEPPIPLCALGCRGRRKSKNCVLMAELPGENSRNPMASCSIGESKLLSSV